MEKYNDSWDNVEDVYPAGDENELEYIEDTEDEDEEYKHIYYPVQGNWDPRDFEEEGYTSVRQGRRMKIHSVKVYDEVREKERKKNQKKIRKEAKAREKQRQKYYHYEDNE